MKMRDRKGEVVISWVARLAGIEFIRLTQWAITRADKNGGKRNLWLRLLDRLGLGFDSQVKHLKILTFVYLIHPLPSAGLLRSQLR